MSDGDRHERLIRDGMEAFNRGDMTMLATIFDERLESRVGPQLANSGTWRGREGFTEMITTWGEAFESQRNRIIGFTHPDDRHVIAEVHQAATGAGSRVPVEMTLFYLFEFRDDKVVRLHLYAERDEALEAAGG